MGLLRSFAKKVVGKLSGGGASASASPSSPREPAARRPVEEPVVEDASALATIECGAQELKERLGAGEPVVVLDVREPSETAGGVIPGARLIPLGQFEARWEELKDVNEIVCYCAAGARSLRAAHFLREKGLFNATSMEGGISAWMECGGEVRRAS